MLQPREMLLHEGALVAEFFETVGHGLDRGAYRRNLGFTGQQKRSPVWTAFGSKKYAFYKS
jgi:hypothetical protein